MIVDLLIMPNGTRYITSRAVPGRKVKVESAGQSEPDATLKAIKLFEKRYDIVLKTAKPPEGATP